MQKILYLPIETIAREFDARVLLAHEAVSRGYAVIIGQRDNVFKAAEKMKHGIYFYKSHGYENFPKNENPNEKTFKYVSLDEEGLVFVDDNQYIVKSKPDKLDHLDIIFTWGQYQKDLLVKENPKLEKRIAAIGNPRFDLLRPEFHYLYKKTAEKIKKKWGKYILINTMFVPGNYSRLYGCSYLDARKHQFEVFIGREPTKKEQSFLVSEENYYKKLFKQYADMLQLLSAEFPEMNFILRPHPSEDILNWKDALKNLKNVHVIFKGSAIEWILGAVMLIHTGCTTGIEAWAMGKEVIAYNPNDQKGIEPPLPNKFSYKISNVMDLIPYISDALNGRFKGFPENMIDTARQFISSIDGDYSVKRFMNAVESLNTDNENVKAENGRVLKIGNVESFKSALKIKILKFLSKYQTAIKKYAGRKIYSFIYDRFNKYPGLFAQFKKFPKLGAKEIRDRLNTYDSILSSKNTADYYIKKIATDVFWINKKSF